MEEVGLHTALAKWPCLLDIIFPEEKERTILGDEFKGKLTFEEKEANHNNSKAADFFTEYITLIESRKEGTLRFMVEV